MAKKKNTKTRQEAELAEAEVHDELIALESIYESSCVVHDDHSGFDLTLQPHPGEADVNYVSCRLIARQVSGAWGRGLHGLQ